MGLLPVGVKWEVEITAKPFQKLTTDILIYRRIPDDNGHVRALYFETGTNGKITCNEKTVEIFGQIFEPSLQLPWEVMQPLAEALFKYGITAGQDTKLAGIVEAQKSHLSDLRDVVLAFINEKKPALILQPSGELINAEKRS